MNRRKYYGVTSNTCDTIVKTPTDIKGNKFHLIELPYATDALEPVISKTTILFHHGKHLQTYVDNLNRLVVGTIRENMTLEQIVTDSDGAIFNNAGQILNHNLYFQQFSPHHTGQPTGNLATAIEQEWGTFDNFKIEFAKVGTNLFGSGWVWLTKEASGKLAIRPYANAGNPIKDKEIPLLCFDVWEHAYYIDYQNRRAEHLNELWKIIDWNVISKRFNGYK